MAKNQCTIQEVRILRFFSQFRTQADFEDILTFIRLDEISRSDLIEKVLQTEVLPPERFTALLESSSEQVWSSR